MKKIRKTYEVYKYRFICVIYRTREKILMRTIRHLPREIVYRSYIRVVADATTGAYNNQNVAKLYSMDALDRWDKRDGGDHTNKKLKHEQVTKTYCGNSDCSADECGGVYDNTKKPVEPEIKNPVLFSGYNQPSTLHEVVFQGLGAASTCWEDMSGTGIFESDRAKTIGDEMVAWIKENYIPITGVISYVPPPKDDLING